MSRLASQTCIPPRLIALLLVFWTVGLLRLSEPFYGVRDNLEIWIPSAVRNYELYGAQELGYMVTTTPAPVDDITDLTYYSHHPPLVAWVPALMTQFTGFHEAGMRFPFLLAAMLAASAFYVLVRRAFDARMAFWATLFFTLTPMIAYFETSYNHDPLGFMASMLFAAVFVNWWRQPTPGRTLALTGLLVLGVWTAWPAVFMVAVFCLLAFIWGNMGQRLAVVGWGLLAIASFVGMMGYYETVHPGSIDSLLNAFVWRTSSASLREGSESFTVFQWIATNGLHILVFGTISIVALAAIGLHPLWRRSSKQGKLVFLAVFGGGLLYLAFFRNAAFIHDYYKAWLMPTLAIAAAATMVWVRPRLRRSRAVIDGMVLSFFLHGIAIMFVLMTEFHKPVLDETMAYIRAEVPHDVTLLLTNDDWRMEWGHEKIVAFYTDHPVYLNEPLERVQRRNHETTVLHINCPDDDDNTGAPPPQNVENAEVIATIAETCTVVRYPPQMSVR